MIKNYGEIKDNRHIVNKDDQIAGQIRCNILCSKIYQPVCGLDDKKYSNQCEAECAKTVCY